MTGPVTPDERPRPTPRARPEDAEPATPAGDPPAPEAAGPPAPEAARVVEAAGPRVVEAGAGPAETAAPAGPETAAPAARAPHRRALVALLAVLCLLAAAGVGLLIWQREDREHVEASVFTATRAGVVALYAYDYRDSEGSVRRKLAVLTGELRDRTEQDLAQGGVIDSYEQASATTRYDVVDVGLQQIDEARGAANLVVFGRYVVSSAAGGTGLTPQGAQCQPTADGAQSCTQIVQVQIRRVGGDWKISQLAMVSLA